MAGLQNVGVFFFLGAGGNDVWSKPPTYYNGILPSGGFGRGSPHPLATAFIKLTIFGRTVNLAYKVPVGTSVFRPLYTKYVLRVYCTLSVIRIYCILSLIDINRTLYTLFDIHVQLHAYIMFQLGYYVFKSFIVTCILHCDCFKCSINTNKVVIEIFYSNMLKLQCLSTWILVACESQATNIRVYQILVSNTPCTT